MSAELTSSSERRQAPSWAVLRDVAVVLAAGALVGVVCGVLWEMWWTPPSGLVLDHVWYPDVEGVRQLVSGTVLFVVVGLAGGVVLGAVCAWFFDRVELVTLAAVVVGSALATLLMYQVGTSLAPPDPTAAAATAEDYTALAGTLDVEGKGAFGALPVGAMTGLTIVFIGMSPTRRLRR